MVMQKTQNQHADNMLTTTQFASLAPCIGHLAGTNGRSDILVEFDGCAPRAAKLVAGLNKIELIKKEYKGREVLLVFEKGNPDYPIIADLMADPLEGLLSLELPGDQNERPNDVLIDGKRITIEAEDEVEIKCGKGSILIQKDGKIIIKGTHFLSRSSGPQRIKGSSVSIN
jgi:hypothetical protein